MIKKPNFPQKKINRNQKYNNQLTKSIKTKKKNYLINKLSINFILLI